MNKLVRWTLLLTLWATLLAPSVGAQEVKEVQGVQVTITCVEYSGMWWWKTCAKADTVALAPAPTKDTASINAASRDAAERTRRYVIDSIQQVASRSQAPTPASTSAAVRPATRVATMDAIWDTPANSKAEIIRRLMTGSDGDSTVMNTKSSQLVAALNEMFPTLRLENRNDLARLIENSDLAPCTPGKQWFSRVRKKDGSFDIKGWEREVHADELCVYPHSLAGLSIFSAWCGNPTSTILRDVPRDVVVEEPAPEEIPEPQPGPRRRPPQTRRVPPPPPQVVVEEKRPPWLKRHWLPVTLGTAVVGGVACAIWCPPLAEAKAHSGSSVSVSIH